MKIFLIGFSFGLSIIICSFLAYRMFSVRQQQESKENIVEKIDEDMELTIERFPEPIIVDLEDLSIIEDLKLRSFVKNNVIDTDKILYFRWRGGKTEKLIGTIIDQEYLISLNVDESEKMLHQQVFIIPYGFEYKLDN